MAERRRLRGTISKKSKVCRSLFGEVDHEELQKDLDREMKILKAAEEQRWNFDFGSESPLPGRYDWERVDNSSPEVPIAYEMPCLSKSATDKAFPIRFTMSRFSSKFTTSGVTPARRIPSRTTVATPTKKVTETEIPNHTVQSKIPSFFPVKKRAAEPTMDMPSKKRRRDNTYSTRRNSLISQ